MTIAMGWRINSFCAGLKWLTTLRRGLKTD